MTIGNPEFASRVLCGGSWVDEKNISYFPIRDGSGPHYSDPMSGFRMFRRVFEPRAKD